MNITSNQLLPYSPETQLPTHIKFAKALKLLKFFIQHTIEAINEFYIDQNIHQFDPHVGETSCQIRAYQILLLAYRLGSINKELVIKKIQALKQLLVRVNNGISFYEKIDSTKRNRGEPIVTLEQFFMAKDYYFYLNEEEFYLVQSKFLTDFKRTTYLDNIDIDYESLCSELEISKNVARRLIHLYQVRLSNVSCDFILDLAKQVSNPLLIETELNLLRKFDDDGRHALPCYFVMRTILVHMRLITPVVLLIIDRELDGQPIDMICLPFRLPSQVGDFVYCKNMTYYTLEQACYVIRGVTKYMCDIESKERLVQKILAVGLEKIILMNMAIHPQYTGNKLSTASLNPFVDKEEKAIVKNSEYLEHELLDMRNKALNYGCSMSNASLFYIEHIYCDQLKRQAHLIYNYYWGSNSKEMYTDLNFSANN